MLAAGGSRNKGASVLTRLHALHEAQQELAMHEAALKQAQGSLKSMAAAAATYRRSASVVPDHTKICHSFLNRAANSVL